MEEHNRNSFGPGVIGFANLDLGSANNSDTESAPPPEKEKSVPGGSMPLPKMGAKQKTSPVLERGRSKNMPTLGRKKGLDEARRTSNSSLADDIRRSSGSGSLGNSVTSASAGDLDELERVAEEEGESEVAPVAASGPLPLSASGPPRR